MHHVPQGICEMNLRKETKCLHEVTIYFWKVATSRVSQLENEGDLRQDGLPT